MTAQQAMHAPFETGPLSQQGQAFRHAPSQAPQPQASGSCSEPLPLLSSGLECGYAPFTQALSRNDGSGCPAQPSPHTVSTVSHQMLAAGQPSPLLAPSAASAAPSTLSAHEVGGSPANAPGPNAPPGLSLRQAAAMTQTADQAAVPTSRQPSGSRAHPADQHVPASPPPLAAAARQSSGSVVTARAVLGAQDSDSVQCSSAGRNPLLPGRVPFSGPSGSQPQCYGSGTPLSLPTQLPTQVPGVARLKGLPQREPHFALSASVGLSCHPSHMSATGEVHPPWNAHDSLPACQFQALASGLIMANACPAKGVSMMTSAQPLKFISGGLFVMPQQQATAAQSLDAQRGSTVPASAPGLAESMRPTSAEGPPAKRARLSAPTLSANRGMHAGGITTDGRPVPHPPHFLQTAHVPFAHLSPGHASAAMPSLLQISPGMLAPAISGVARPSRPAPTCCKRQLTCRAHLNGNQP